MKKTILLTLCFSLIMCSFTGCSNEEVTTEQEVSSVTNNETVKTSETTDITQITDTTTAISTLLDETEENDEEVIIFSNEDDYFNYGENSDFIDDNDLSNEDEVPNETTTFAETAPKKKYKDISQLKILKCNIEYDNVGFFNEGLCPYKDSKTGLWGYMNENFEVAIKPQFFEAECFSEGLAAVYNGEKWGFIDSNGKYKISPKYEGVTSKYSFYGDILTAEYRQFMKGFEDGYAIVSDDETDMLIDKDGNVIHTSKEMLDSSYYHFQRSGNVTLSAAGYNFLCGTDLRKKGDIEVRGSYIEIPMNGMTYNIDCLSKNHAIVKTTAQNGLFVIDSNGKCAIDPYTIENFSHCIVTEDSYIITREISGVHQAAIYDYSGNTILPYYYTSILPVTKDGKALYYIGFFKNEECELLDLDGNVLDKKWFNTSVPSNMRICDSNNPDLKNCAIVYERNGYNMKLVDLDNDTVISKIPQGASMYADRIDKTDFLTSIYGDWVILEDTSSKIHIYDLNGNEYSDGDSLLMQKETALINFKYGIIGLYFDGYIKIQA